MIWLLNRVIGQRNVLFNAIKEHHDQKADDRCIEADDRCIEDDDKLYQAAGLSPCDRRVGDKFAMIQNCMRFVENRCESGGWKGYVELEKERDELQNRVKAMEQYIIEMTPYISKINFSNREVRKKY
jgi:hypothetical protein